jgi:predicted permease
MTHMFQDLRYACRALRKNMMLTLVIVASLAIGIGANSAIFSVVDALLLRPLPYPQPDRLAAVWLHSPALRILRDWPSPGEFIDIQNENHSFEQMALARGFVFALTGRERPERIFGLRTQSSLLRMLGAKPQLGRLLLPEEDKPGKTDVAILSQRIWKRLFNSEPGIIGKTIVLNGDPFLVVGVLQGSFALTSDVMPMGTPTDQIDIFTPLRLGADAANSRSDENFNVMVQLKPGVSVQQAQADIDVIASRIREKDKRDATFGMDVVGLQEQVVGDVRRVLLVVFGSVGLVLLMTCANTAHLLLTRAARREKEVAIRTALGAGWQPLARQMLTEAVLLGFLGGAAGLLVARLSLYIVRTMNPGNIPRLEDISINGTVLVFTMAVSLIISVLFGVAPVWRAITIDLNTSLKTGGRGGQGDGRLRVRWYGLRGLLVLSQLTLSVMLLIGGGLLIRSFVRLQNVPLGFGTDHRLTMEVTLTHPRRLGGNSLTASYKEIESNVAHLPGVLAVGAVSALPLTGELTWAPMGVEGYTPPPGQELQVDYRTANLDYLRTMQIPLRIGRWFTEDDQLNKPRVAVIDERFAQRFWPNGDALGKRLWFTLYPAQSMTIVGVVGAVKQYGLATDDRLAAYYPEAQWGQNRTFLVVRTTSDASTLATAVENQVHAVDPGAVVYGVRTMEDRLHDSLARQRFSSTMLGVFAVFALVLAAVGLYGLMSHLVIEGTHDIGVLMALGARPGNIVSLVLRQGMALAGIGIVMGLGGAAALTRLMTSLLFEVSTTDAFIFGTVPVLLAAVTFAATANPAWRATRVDPMVALREE